MTIARGAPYLSGPKASGAQKGARRREPRYGRLRAARLTTGSPSRPSFTKRFSRTRPNAEYRIPNIQYRSGGGASWRAAAIIKPSRQREEHARRTVGRIVETAVPGGPFASACTAHVRPAEDRGLQDAAAIDKACRGAVRRSCAVYPCGHTTNGSSKGFYRNAP